MIVPLVEATADTCGGKAAGLGALLRAGLAVPDGFVLPFATHGADVDAAVRAGLSLLGATSSPDRFAENDQVTETPVARSALSPDRFPEDDQVSVAVRSSAADEDTAHASAAGQYETVLGVRGAAAVTTAVRACWASTHSDRAVAYRDGAAAAPMAVIVQRLVHADVSGVLFTGDDVAIEASWGLGAGVVGGTVTPDAYRVGADGVVTRTVMDERTRPVLDDDTARALARRGRRIETLLGGPQDVEWAIAAGEVWVLQARPVTAAPPPPAARTATTTAAGLAGTPGSRGVATGPARVVDGPDGFARVRPGDVLVCRFTDPAWTPLLRVAAGVVTETGGALSHAAIVARERRIPAVVGVAGATTRLRDGATITVDGAAGTVTTEE